jgi:hypothetical protein
VRGVYEGQGRFDFAVGKSLIEGTMSRVNDLLVVAVLVTLIGSMLWEWFRDRFFKLRPIFQFLILGLCVVVVIGLILKPETQTSAQPFNITIPIPIPVFSSSEIVLTGQVPILTALFFGLMMGVLNYVNSTVWFMNPRWNDDQIRPASANTRNTMLVAAFTLFIFKTQAPNYFDSNNSSKPVVLGLAMALCLACIAIPAAWATKENAGRLYVLPSIGMTVAFFFLFWT